MPSGTDYTKLPNGTKLKDGTIEKCPHCGKSGLPTNVQGRMRYNHGTVLSTGKNQVFSVDFAWCPKEQDIPD